MLFNSYQFLIFFPLVVVLYFIIPKRLRTIWLLAASYYFYMSWSPKYVLLLLTSTVITYLSGLLIYSVGRKKLVVAASFISNLGILAVFKYYDFFINSLNALLSAWGLQLAENPFSLLLPVGISFYTFQALSYTMDVYRGEIKPEGNFINYALFVSFFPQLVAGPIERSKNLLGQLKVAHRFDFERMRDGLLLMVWGFFLKLVIADRVAVVVNTVFGNPAAYPGCYLIVGALLFTIQIYCDFAGYSIIAIGAAKILGVKLMENFNCPYFAQSVAEFWRRWHISLSTWFRDYLYIPLGGNRQGRWRQNFNTMVVMLVSGLWHGANWKFVVWGGLHGLCMVLSRELRPLRERCRRLPGIAADAASHRLLQQIITFSLVCFAFIFFRADSISSALTIIHSIFTVHNPWVLLDGSLYTLGLSPKSFVLMLLAIGILWFADLCQYRGISISGFVTRQEFWFRWSFYVLSVLFVLTFGVWGAGYDAAAFIYFQF